MDMLAVADVSNTVYTVIQIALLLYSKNNALCMSVMIFSKVSRQ